MNAPTKWLSLTLMVALPALSACKKIEKTDGPDTTRAVESDAQTSENSKRDAHTSDEQKKAEPANTNDDDEQRDVHSDHKDAQATSGPTSLDELPDGLNVVQHEMLLLNDAMIGVFSLIINNKLEDVPARIHSVHSARELTHSAVTGGQYKPPKNSEDIHGFEKLDQAFHADLVELVKASKQDDLKLATEKYADVMQGCTNCHTQYRY